MESKYRNSGFEEYVKNQADQHRMFPSEKVWKNIHGALHTKRKWYGIGLASLLLLTGTAVTLVMISYPVSKKQVAVIPQVIPQKTTSSSSKTDISKTILPFNGQVADQSKPLFSETANRRPGLMKNNGGETIITSIPEQIHATGNERERVSVINRPRTSSPADTKAGMPEYNSIADNQVEEQQPVIAEEKTISKPRASSELPLTIESVTNAYQPKKAGRKTSWQFFITPTVSYRKLKVNESLINTSATNFPLSNLTDVNNAVTHKPDMGLQIGASFHRPLTKSLRIRGGFQFNINRYDIKAFTYNPEVATIRLNDANGAAAVWAWTAYRNYSGYKSNWLKNYYFSIAAPIGAEMKILGNKKTSFGIASTLQPTFIIKDKAYLISTDYKNYANVPSLVRKINVNAGFEAFINYSNGKTRWQIGPQARYQLLSSFRSEYPVKEHLFDFGLKMGVFINEK